MSTPVDVDNSLALVAEVQRLREENQELRTDYGEIRDNLQAAANTFDDGSHAGDNLDEAIVALLTEAKADNAALEANVTRLHIRLANISDFTFNGLNEPGGALKWLEEIDRTLDGDYDDCGAQS